MEISYKYEITGVSVITANIQVIQVNQQNIQNLDFYNSGDLLQSLQYDLYSSFNEILYKNIISDDKKNEVIKNKFDNILKTNTYTPFINTMAGLINALKHGLEQDPEFISNYNFNSFENVTVENYITKLEWDYIGTDEIGNSAKTSGISYFSVKEPKINSKIGRAHV